MPLKGRRRCRSLPPDILSNLPDDIIDVILIRLPCNEAVRTSILSKKWRYHWRRLTELTLDQSISLENGIQHLVLHLPQNEDEAYKLSSLFTCSQLRHLTLDNCLIHPPTRFQGFDRLITLELCNVTISSELLGSLISHCSLLEKLVLEISEVPISNIIEINASKLKSFDFSGCISYISLTNVPLLKKVSLNLYEGSSMEAQNVYFVKFFESYFALEHLLFKFCIFDQVVVAL
ncbi:hypothetical protein H5410_054424 [Solanum commersonii]|uniref:F-box domain-containing protein n=1 Tax=Solanum commersonii TaxID=4109 RepID=A0A9J5WFA2_SOLCO|nr:hypothetical protein H5410_054424 [Solanum commersonii]